MNVLLVEDDSALAKSLQIKLELEGFKIHWVRDLPTAERKKEEHIFSLIILDLEMVKIRGLQFLQEICRPAAHTPVIALTSSTDEDTAVKSLELGAADFVKKPFGARELLTRMRSVLKDSPRQESQLRYADLLFLTDQRRVQFGKKSISLNRREYDILLHMVENANNIISRGALLSHLDKDGEIFDRTVDSHISHLRARLKEIGVKNIKISSVYGIGYRLEKI